MKIIKRYRFFVITIFIVIVLCLINFDLGMKAIHSTGYQIKEMLFIIPPIFILLGLLDVWVPREAMVRYMGEDSGIKGILLAIFIGSAAAGPLYGAFPIAAVLMKKGAKLSNVLIFIGAWSTTKIPMFLFELAALGPKFAVTRLIVDLIGIVIIAYILEGIMSENEKQLIYKNIEKM